MAKKLITIHNIHSYLEPESKSFMMDKEMLLTSGAKDYLRQKGYTIDLKQQISSTKKEAAKDCLTEQVKKLVIQDFQIKDPQLQRQVIKAVMEKIHSQ
ncbi:hypothetical protein SAMN05192551_10253 [Tindallia magadiensis]|uniref:Uncharacterized protein n=1 Tax=Tindallia magadiensis TaxID=69895 RepID=A0A1I3BVB0_9FIRM|nr:hypothetical protein [Tindallia magadiensis]SFH66227.1 hypothetical protein SAMN05192551_10253 [Tindallia magadiensis]